MDANEAAELWPSDMPLSPDDVVVFLDWFEAFDYAYRARMIA